MRNTGIILILLFLFAGCKKTKDAAPPSDNGNEEGNSSHVSSPQSITFYSGRNRALLSWPHTDSKITKAKVYWNNGADSVVQVITPSMDSVKIPINNLGEGDYNMDIFAFDKANNKSAKVLKSGHVYGKIYEAAEKKIENVTYQDDQSLKINWEVPNNESATGAQIYYTNENESTEIGFVERVTEETVLKNISSANRGTIKYRTIYAPKGLIIDTLFTESTTVSYVNRKAVFDSLPGWKFRCKIKAEAQTVSDFGGMPGFKKKIDEALFKASKKFQASGLNDAGNHEIHFYMTDISSFNGTSEQFRYIKGVDDPTMDLMIIVNGHASENDLSWGWLGAPYLSLGHDYSGLFVPNAIDALAHELGHSRGMYDLYLEEVNKASDNPINGQTYEAKDGMMNYPYGNSKWSDLSQLIINESSDQKVAVKYWNYFPNSFQIIVKQKDGTSAKGAQIKIYPVGHGTSPNKVRENDVIMYRGTTDASGSYDFDGNNPFAIDQDPSKVVFNFLVQIEYKGSTAYQWMPLDDALLAGGKGTPYTLTVKMQ